jgi:hypothetical protein
MNHLTLRSATLGLAAVLLAAAPASAAKLVIKDATGDVWHDGSSYTEAGTVANADLKKVVVRHTRKVVVLKGTYTDLKKSDDLKWFVMFLRTNEKRRRFALVRTTPAKPQGVHMLTNMSADNLKCAGVTHEIDYALNTITLSLPRTCLSNPRWVQAQGGAVLSESMVADEAYVDDMATTGPEPKTWSKRVWVG